MSTSTSMAMMMTVMILWFFPKWLKVWLHIYMWFIYDNSWFIALEMIRLEKKSLDYAYANLQYPIMRNETVN
jgi:hypothetical protein